MSITKQAAELLTSETATTAQLQEMYSVVKQHRIEQDARLKQITSADRSGFGNVAGPERRAAWEQGDKESVRKMDEEEKDIGADLEILLAQEKKLRSRLDIAKARDGAESAPELYTALRNQLREQADALAAYRATQQETEKQFARLRQVRADAHRLKHQGEWIEIVPADPALLEGFISVFGFEWSPVGGWGASHRHIEQAADALGLAMPAMPGATRKAS